MSDKNFIDFKNKEVDPRIARTVQLFKDGGAYSDMSTFRANLGKLKASYNNVFDSDFSLTSKTRKTQILRSAIARIVVSIYQRTIAQPSFDIEPVNTSATAYKEKTKASLVKAMIEWFIRVSGYEDVFNEMKENWNAFGNGYIRPSTRPTSKPGVTFPIVEDLRGDDLLLDPNATYITSESFSKQSQFYGHTNIYPKRNLIARFGPWILDYAQPGFIVDERRYPGTKTSSSDSGQEIVGGPSKGATEIENYEVLEVQNKAIGEEYLLVGGNAFPVIRRVEGDNTPIPAELNKIKDKIEWGNKYIYKNSMGENVIMLAGFFMFFDQDSIRDWGLIQMLATPQVMHEIVMNLVADNMAQRLDQIKYIAGGNSSKIDKTFEQYRKEKLVDRNAMWKIPSSLADKNLPTPGVLKFEGLTAQEGLVVEQQMMDISKNMAGVDPQQQEVQKNTGLGQTEIVQEKSIEAIAAITDANMSNFRTLYKTFLTFMIAHKGFGLKDVNINFTKYWDEGTEQAFPSGIDDAEINIVAAAELIKGFEFDVIIDKSTLINRSRTVEVRQLIDLLGLHDPQADPAGWKFIRDKIAKMKGLVMPEVSEESIAQSRPQGGISQFGGAPGAAPIEAPVPPK